MEILVDHVHRLDRHLDHLLDQVQDQDHHFQGKKGHYFQAGQEVWCQDHRNLEIMKIIINFKMRKEPSIKQGSFLYKGSTLYETIMVSIGQWGFEPQPLHL